MNPASKKAVVKKAPAKKKPKAVAKPEHRRATTTTRSNRRSEKTIDQILTATIEVLMSRGTSKLFVREVCDKVGISRGTLYRYFASKEELLEAVVIHMREGTDRNVNALVDQYTDPDERFGEFLKTLSGNNIEIEESHHLLEAEPEFLINYLKHNFAHFTNRLDRALGPIYDVWDQELGAKIDRELINEIFVRLALSKTIVPASHNMQNALSRLGDMIQLLRPQKIKTRSKKTGS